MEIEMRDILIYLAIKYSGDFNMIYEAIKNKWKIDGKECKEVLKTLKCHTLTMVDATYPSFLRALHKPPFVLFYYGNIDLLTKNKKIGVVGTRKPSEYGISATEKLLIDVLNKKEVTIVSGMAMGIDQVAHQTALKMNKNTIGVLANGIDTFYLKKDMNLYDEIKVKGLIISEYPFNCPVKKENFVSRNRIIAAISDVLLVTEAKIKSGTSFTVNYGLDLGKTILCVPDRIDNDSLCNAYIQQGAKLIMDAKDIIEEI